MVMKINERINMLFEELGYGMLRKNKSGEITYINKFLEGKDLSLCNLQESKTEPGIFYVSLYEDLEMGVYRIGKKGENESSQTEINYINKYLSRITDGVLDIERYIQETTHNDIKYTLLEDKDLKKYYMTHSKGNSDYNFLYDKTQLLELEMHLDTISKLSELSHLEKKHFVTNMIHDLRTPLSSIISLLSLLTASSNLKQQQRYIKMMRECSYSLLETINDILDYTRLEVGDIVLECTPCNIPKIIDDVTIIIKEMIQQNCKKSTRFNTFTSIDIPEKIYIDIKRIKQIILNIVSHSLLYIDSGSLEIRVTSISSEKYLKVMGDIPKCKKCNRYACHLCRNKIMCYCKDNQCICCNKETTSDENDNKDIYLQFEIIDTGKKVEKEKIQAFTIHNFTEMSGLLGMYIVNRLVYLMDGNFYMDVERKEGNRYIFVIRVNKKSGPNISKLLKDKLIMVLVYDTDLRIEFLKILGKYTKNLISVSSITEANFYIDKHSDLDLIIGDTRVNEIETFMKSIKNVQIKTIGYKKSTRMEVINDITTSGLNATFSKFF